MTSTKDDLDELVLKCRDDRARSYLAEAIASYKAGAFRAAIVSTWIAVCFDFIEKLRELSLGGDKEAERQVEELERTRKAGDMTRALKFEREILISARDKFELISHIECVDLERLQEDRNRCAHPSLVSDEEVYAPSAELARAHIKASVTHLLQHPPAQGKYALDRLVREVNSDYFPSDLKQAVVAFSSGPLKKARTSLVRNFTLILMKRFFDGDVSHKRRTNAAAALGAIEVMHAEEYADTMKSKLSSMFRALEDDQLATAIGFLERVKGSWEYLAIDIRLRLQNFVQHLPSSAMDDLDFLLRFEPLCDHAKSRVRWASRTDLDQAFFFGMPENVADRYITLLFNADTHSEATGCASQLGTSAMDLTEANVRKILTKRPNSLLPILGSEWSVLLDRLRVHTKIPLDEFDRLDGRKKSSSGFDDMDDDIPF